MGSCRVHPVGLCAAARLSCLMHRTCIIACGAHLLCATRPGGVCAIARATLRARCVDASPAAMVGQGVCAQGWTAQQHVRSFVFHAGVDVAGILGEDARQQMYRQEVSRGGSSGSSSSSSFRMAGVHGNAPARRLRKLQRCGGSGGSGVSLLCLQPLCSSPPSARHLPQVLTRLSDGTGSFDNQRMLTELTEVRAVVGLPCCGASGSACCDATPAHPTHFATTIPIRSLAPLTLPPAGAWPGCQQGWPGGDGAGGRQEGQHPGAGNLRAAPEESGGDGKGAEQFGVVRGGEPWPARPPACLPACLPACKRTNL